VKQLVALANALPGLLKVALRPPVSVDAVAGAGIVGLCAYALSTLLEGIDDDY
jgi:threonine dehydrogenase-like Zn-dependent dehydrogenase